MNVLELTQRLYEVKEEETAVKNKRLQIEEQLTEALNIPDQWEGSKTMKVDRFKVNVSRKMNTRIDKSLILFAGEKGLTEYLGKIFRWKPELDKKQWDSSDENIRAAFSEVVVQTPGKPSFTVTVNDKEENEYGTFGN